MYAHIQLGAQDLGAMTAFYDAVLSNLGWVRVTSTRPPPAGVIWTLPGSRWPQFVLNKPLNGRPATAANGSQVSFLCESRVAVDKAWSSALAEGAKDNGRPGIRHVYAADFYAAYCLDPEGHKLCFVHTDG
ncbi:VOC family protein [Variovorax sp. LT1R16]|uniref:VOC family protein n=1 Tax=Variovorax sp. LT1R16 TaxID=3443728 RepID=UPI003F44E10B